ncbi:MAG: pyridoxal phosphate-dependent aminotransferase [Planctomycetota bacterium]|nr:pyridoxal phosphate-dependent aminotransferase [Planctomycetota bacterium]
MIDRRRRVASLSAESIQPFLAMEILERAQELEQAGCDIVHLELGEPDFNVPACVERAMSEACRQGITHYTHSLGEIELREEISSRYRKRYGVDVPVDRILVTAGTSGALVLLMAHLLDPGDDVLVPDPGYACYPNFIRAFHGVPRRFQVRAESGFRYDPDDLRRLVSPRTRAIFLNSPSNPTAAVQDLATLEALSRLGVPVISDEIYHALEYGVRADSILQVTDEAFVIDGFSKRYAMTGFRIGWLVAPSGALDNLQKLQQNLFVCASSLSQHGAVAALRGADADVAAMLEEYSRRREILLRGLQDLGLRVPAEPRGAYYMLADASHVDGDSLRLARRILEEAHVGVTPGIDFGPGAEGFLRFSYSVSPGRIEAGLARLRDWLADRGDRSGADA